MSRREWSIAVASAVAWAGMARGQAPAFIPGGTPTPVAAEGAPGSIVTLRTAGQPERRLQILKTERLPDGKILTEVKDLTSGAIFTIADTKVLGSGEPAKAPLPMIAPAPQSQQSPQAPATLPGTTVPATALPQAKPRTADPLLGGATATMPMTAKPQGEYPTLMSRITDSKPANAPATVAPAAPPKQSAINAALFGSNATPPTPTPTLMGRLTDQQMTPTAPTSTFATTNLPAPTPSSSGLKAAVFGSPTAQPQEMPTLMGKLFPDKPAEKAAPPQAVPIPVQAIKPPPQNVIRPAAMASSAPASPVNVVAYEKPVPMPVAAVLPQPMPQPRPVIQQAEALAPISSDARDPNFHVVPAKAMTMKQIEDQVKELRMNNRPSARVEAANALAGGPMGGMVEVRQILAEASYRDPEPIVRAHCIDVLFKMGYDEPNYRKYVESLVNDEEPAIRRAARASMR